MQKDISSLRNEVASTVEQRKEMTDRLEKAKQERTDEEPTDDKSSASEEKEPVVSEAGEKTTGRKRRFVKNLIKKVIMPWKKWGN